MKTQFYSEGFSNVIDFYMENKKIKVLFRHRSMEMGGVEKVLLSMLNGLNKDKFEISLLLSLNQGELRDDIPKDIHFSYLVKGKEDFSKNPIINKIQLLWRRILLGFYTLFPSITYKLKTKNNFDIEIATTYGVYEDILKSPIKKSKKIAWLHSDLTYPTAQYAILKNLIKFDYIIYGALHTKNCNENAFKYNIPNSVIYNTIDIKNVLSKSKFEKIKFDDYPVFISVGRLHYRKGYYNLLQIHKRLIDEGFNHSIILIGNGEDYSNLTLQANQLKVQNTFKLLGGKKNPYPYIKAADFFILPSESESYPLIIGETMVLKKPIISTNVGGISEMIDHEVNGLLTEIDETSIYNAMVRFLTDKNLVENIIENNKKAYLKFDNEKIYNQVENILINLHKS